MSLYRGAGGASDATDDSTVNAVAGYASAAASSASSAATSATSASNSASAAASSASGAASSASSVAANTSNAASSASLASTYAANASASKDAAAASAATASTKAGEATSSASSAASDASTATTKASEAAASALAADGSADAAAASAADALAIYGSTAAVDAAVASAAASAVTASTQAGYSSDSASDSAASAVLAFENSQNAGEWATVAQGSANSAQASSSSASTYASNASTSASSAALSASNALTSANNAAASASTASTIVGSGNGIFGTTPISTSGTVTLSGGTANGVTYLNASKVLTSGSALTFDGAALRVTGSTGLYFSGSTAGHAYMAVDGTSTADYLWFGTNTNIPVIHYINGSEQMRLTSTGLGIGTSSPQSKLHIDVDGTALRISRGSSIGFLYNTGTASTDITRLQSNGGSVQLYTTGGNATLDSAGNLGVGTTSTTNSAGYKTIGINGSTGGQIEFQTGGTGKQYIYSTGTDITYRNDNGAIIFFSSFERARIDSSGNLLVGTTTNATGAKLTAAGGVGTSNPSGRFATVEYGSGASGLFTTITISFTVDSASSSVIIETLMTGFSGVYLDHVAARYSNQAAVVMRNNASSGTTVASLAVDGTGLIYTLTITTSVTHPVVKVKATSGGLGSTTTLPTITFA